MTTAVSTSSVEPVHAASIVHITNTHLFVDQHGTTRSARSRTRLVRWLDRLDVSDLDYAPAGMTERFANALQRAVDLERAALPIGNVVAVQTGDTEAFGSAQGGDAYSGFRHLGRALHAAGLGGAAVAMYGNHDVWPGRVALFGLNGPRHDAQKHTLADVVELVGQLPAPAPIRVPTGVGFDGVFVPLNSVNSHRCGVGSSPTDGCRRRCGIDSAWGISTNRTWSPTSWQRPVSTLCWQAIVIASTRRDPRAAACASIA